MITNRMAHNLLLHLSINTLPTTGAAFLVVSISHLSAYYYFVLRPLLSDDPMVCSTCLEIRSFTLASFIPVVMGTGIAVTSNLSACLVNRTIHLPQFKIEAYPEWIRFLRQHAFKGMSRRHYAAYPLISGFLASMIFLGQNYYWKNNLRHRLDSLEQQLSQKQSQKRNRLLGPVEDYIAKFFGRKP